tara:strand:+ start:1780 stop:1986 length:207 start_codon:yes stop_codon:yes gene_type:complete
MSATRIKTDMGEGEINGMKTAEKKLEPNLQQGSANDKGDLDNDGKMDEYELARSAAIMKAMAKREKSA